MLGSPRRTTGSRDADDYHADGARRAPRRPRQRRKDHRRQEGQQVQKGGVDDLDPVVHQHRDCPADDPARNDDPDGEQDEERRQRLRQLLNDGLLDSLPPIAQHEQLADGKRCGQDEDDLQGKRWLIEELWPEDEAVDDEHRQEEHRQQRLGERDILRRVVFRHEAGRKRA